MGEKQKRSEQEDMLDRKDVLFSIISLCALIGGIAAGAEYADVNVGIIQTVKSGCGFAFFAWILSTFLTVIICKIWSRPYGDGKQEFKKHAISILLVAAMMAAGIHVGGRITPPGADPEYTCDACGGSADDWSIETQQGTTLCINCLEDGMLSGDYALCKVCNQIIEHGEFFENCCRTCYESGYGICTCGEFIREEDVVYLDDGTQMCWKCIGESENIEKCMDCGVYYYCHDDPDSSTKEYCRACVAKNTRICDVCGASGLPITDLAGCEISNIVDDYWMCAQCLTKYMEEVGDYDLQQYVIENTCVK